MSHDTKRSTHPGPWWLWVAAWSAQGLGLLVTEAARLESAVLRFSVTGLLAALPLAALYRLLLGPGMRSSR